MTSHKIAALAQASIKGPATFKSAKSCHTRKGVSSARANEISPYKVQDAVYSILERSGGDLDKASHMLDERLNAANRMIRELSETSDSLSHEEFRQRMRILKAQHRGAAEMTEDLRAAAASAAASNGHVRRKSVTFDDAKPPLPRQPPRSHAAVAPTSAEAPARVGSGGPGGGGLAGRRPMSASLEGANWPRSPVDDLDDDFEYRLDGEDEAAGIQRRRAQQERLRGRVKALWSDFDVHGSRQRESSHQHQHQHRRSGSLDRGWRPEDDADSTDAWRHRVTVPRPFSMTLRQEEETAAAADEAEARKSRSMRLLEADELRRREAEAAECRVRPRAAPVPAHVYQPLLRQLDEQREARRRQVREHSAEILRATERPFSFAKRDAERKRQGGRSASGGVGAYHRSAAGDREATVIRAKPAPPSGAAERARQLRSEAEQRRAKARLRSEANLRAAAMPGEMAERQRRMEARRDAKIASSGQRPGGRRPSSADGRQRPAVGRDAPDFDRLHRQFELEMLERQAELRVTRPEPFRLLTGQRAHVAQEHTDKCLASGQDPRARRTLYDFSRRYPTDPAEDDADAAEAEAAVAERERRRRAAMSRDPDAEYNQKLRELDRKMKERDQLLAEQARMLAQQQACARYRQSLLEAGVDPARIGALVRAYRERELASGSRVFGDGEEFYGDGYSTVPTESEFDEEQRGNLDETRFGAPSPVPV